MITEANDTQKKQEQTSETETGPKCAVGKTMLVLSKITDAAVKDVIYQKGRADGLEAALKISHHWGDVSPDQEECDCEECNEERKPETVSRVCLAKALHEAGREAVEKGNTVAAEKFGEPTRTFIEWDDLTQSAKDGRLSQAKFLLEKFNITPKQSD